MSREISSVCKLFCRLLQDFSARELLTKVFSACELWETKCPHCRQENYPVNKGDIEPSCITEGVFLFRLEYETFRAKSLADRADERWDSLPSLIPLPGWAQYRRMYGR